MAPSIREFGFGLIQTLAYDGPPFFSFEIENIINTETLKRRFEEDRLKKCTVINCLLEKYDKLISLESF